VQSISISFKFNNSCCVVHPIATKPSFQDNIQDQSKFLCHAYLLSSNSLQGAFLQQQK